MSKPWITQGILTSIKKRDQIHKLFIKSKNTADKLTLETEFKKYHNLIVLYVFVEKAKKTIFLIILINTLKMSKKYGKE